MRRLLLFLACCAAVGSCAPLMDERWEGEATDCSQSVQDFEVIMLLNRAGSDVPGYFGQRIPGSDDNWSMALIEDPENSNGKFIFEVRFDSGSGSTRWDVELEATNGKYTGEVEINTSPSVTCDLELEPVSG